MRSMHGCALFWSLIGLAVLVGVGATLDRLWRIGQPSAGFRARECAPGIPGGSRPPG
jgi:hypothetical protein